MRNSVVVARLAMLALVALGGCKSGKERAFQTKLHADLFRPQVMTSVARATVGSKLIETSPPQYFMDVAVADNGPSVATDHAVYVVHGNTVLQYLGTIPLTYSPNPAPAPGGSISGSESFTFDVNVFNSMNVNDEVVIDQSAVQKTTIGSLDRLYSGFLQLN